ncbi:hypothetical protein BV22DRAFT_891880 [Leucogyrophana mollusca]|uniref:Uncharacterized protein n=1 Tax=Leucogyrophana mollusca TaxID=85980 RepID=A0ACB8B1D7_9AGAM|nr:hypothetical protein BV22DRAFT_891880 [Leucogyrophana mollusca]
MSVFTGTHSTAKGPFGSIAVTTGSVPVAFRGESDGARLASAGAHQLSILSALSSLRRSTKVSGLYTLPDTHLAHCTRRKTKCITIIAG